jgi:hypothetical protein
MLIDARLQIEKPQYLRVMRILNCGSFVDYVTYAEILKQNKKIRKIFLGFI